MDPKRTVQEKAELILADLEAKINKLKEKVEKLCESTDCFKSPNHNEASINKNTQNK
jgi:hypothetical protein